MKIEWNPQNHDPIGDCVVCHDPVYPYRPENINDEEPVMHKECGL